MDRNAYAPTSVLLVESCAPCTTKGPEPGKSVDEPVASAGIHPAPGIQSSLIPWVPPPVGHWPYVIRVGIPTARRTLVSSIA